MATTVTKFHPGRPSRVASARRLAHVLLGQEAEPAILEIVDVSLDPAVPEPGETVDVEVTVRDRAGLGELKTGYVTVTSESVDGTIITSCFTMDAGGTTRVDDSSVAGTLDGEFEVPEGGATLQIRAGGFDQDDAPDCNGWVQTQPDDTTEVFAGAPPTGGGSPLLLVGAAVGVIGLLALLVFVM